MARPWQMLNTDKWRSRITESMIRARTSHGAFYDHEAASAYRLAEMTKYPVSRWRSRCNSEWYSGTLRDFKKRMAAHPQAKRFSEMRSRPPDATVYYDDGFMMGYEVSTETEQTDEDGRRLQFSRVEIHEVGVGPHCIYWGSLIVS